MLRSPMTRVVKVLTAAAKNKWKQRARRRELRQRTGYDGPVNLPIGNYRSTPFLLLSNPFPSSSMPSLTIALGNYSPLCFLQTAMPHQALCQQSAFDQTGPDPSSPASL